MIYVMSDIHGNFENFESIIEQIDLRPEDGLYVLGDVIDRHPYGLLILQKIMKMGNVHMVLGNHEYMMMEALGFPYKKVKEMIPRSIFGNESMDLWYGNDGGVTPLSVGTYVQQSPMRHHGLSECAASGY